MHESGSTLLTSLTLNNADKLFAFEPNDDYITYHAVVFAIDVEFIAVTVVGFVFEIRVIIIDVSKHGKRQSI